MNKKEADFYKCVITDEGKACAVKQNNGILYNVIGAYLISDPNNFFKKYYYKTTSTDNKTETTNKLNEITLKQLKANTQLIYNNITYRYYDNKYIPLMDIDENNPLNYIFPVDLSFDKDDDKTTNFCSYDVIIEKSSVSIVNEMNSDCIFDGVVLITKPFKNDISDENVDILDEQEFISFAIYYFPDDGDDIVENDNKLSILQDQNNKLVFDMELKINLADYYNVNNITYQSSNYTENITLSNVYDELKLGIHLVNDGKTNTINNNKTFGGTNKMLLLNDMDTETTASNTDTNNPYEFIKTYDSLAKLNIMSEAQNETSSNLPQIMLGFTDKKTHTWNGDRLFINYTSGQDAATFRMTEITGTFRQKLNYELIGSNNIYNGSISGTHNNSFIYSENNKLYHNVNDTSFINSNGNSIQEPNNNNIKFIDSDNNTFNNINASSNNIAFIHSNNNTFNPTNVLNNDLLIHSDNNIFAGNNNTNNTNNTTLINSNSGYIENNNGNLVAIGNDLSFIQNVNANTIAIGKGLLNVNNNSDKIILGNFNQNSYDDNEILIVGDGYINDDYLNNLSADKFKEISGIGSNEPTASLYRHNIFTVNKNGYITISDYSKPSNSARYGYNGITAFVDGITYDIPFNKIYNKINIEDAVTQLQESVDSYTTQMNDIINTMPSNFNYTVSSNCNILYINRNPDEDAANYDTLSGKMDNVDSNTIINITYDAGDDQDKSLTIVWNYLKTNTENIKENILSASATIQPYCSKQFLLLKPDVNDGKVSSYSGICEIRN